MDSKISYKQIILNILFILSTTIMTGILSLHHSIPYIIVNVISSFTILCILIIRFNVLQKFFDHSKKDYFIISIIFAIVSSTQFIIYINQKSQYMIDKMSTLFAITPIYDSLLVKYVSFFLGILAYYSVFILWYYSFNMFFPSIRSFMYSLDKLEKRFLIYSTIFFLLLILFIYGQTNVFYSPSISGNLLKYDVVYTTDTGDHIFTNIYANISSIENDLKQPLFGLFALPLGVVATIVSKLLFFIPNSYPIALAGMQVIILNITCICISRILAFKSWIKIMFLLIYTLSYPFMLFLFNLEQYVLSVFFLIAFLYVGMSSEKHNEHEEFLYIAATGSLLTSGICFPLLFKRGDWVNGLKKIYKTAIQFIILVILFGQLPWFLYFREIIGGYSQYTGIGLTFLDRLFQYISFISSCFFAPNTVIDTMTYGYVTYQLAPVTKINILGILILAIVILGFVLNYKNKFAKICFTWVIYSFVLLCIIGWGTRENGLILYSLYFSWAFLSLVFMTINKLFEKLPKVKVIIFSIIIISMLLINSIGIWNLIQFGLLNYPV